MKKPAPTNVRTGFVLFKLLQKTIIYEARSIQPQLQEGMLRL